ncbi:hypothetical protein IQ07DRAFT_618487 [Pyrenochaeta sp. DS3sAY3a]|nr:hypothetical protein IQ07DRAFT_618487 [Pyrenochaeta sp. DS3sAY3a]
MSAEIEEEEEVFDALKYARSYGLCSDYTFEEFDVGDISVPSNQAFFQDLQHPTEESISISLAKLLREKLTVNKDAALLLRDVLTIPVAPVLDSSAVQKPIRKKDLTQEPPILFTDEELDLLEFGNADMPDYKDLRIPTEVTNDENDEGFKWPSKYLQYPEKFEKQVKSERLVMPKEALIYLQDAIRDDFTAADAERNDAEAFNHRRTIVRHITPPLLPMSPPFTPYIPSSPANHIPLPSDSSDSVIAEAKNLQEQIMAADARAFTSPDTSDPMLLDIMQPPPFSPLFESQVSLPFKRRAEDLKVDGPLTPPMFSDSPMKKLKYVSFAEILQEYIPSAPRMDESSADEFNDSDMTDEFFKTIEPLAKEAKRIVENEQLSAADTTARVQVPEVDFSLPLAPWDEYSEKNNRKQKSDYKELDAQAVFLQRIKREDLKSATSWHGISALERELKWGLFTTKIPPVNLSEQLHGDVEVTKILNEMSLGDGIATSLSQIWKPAGLRILDEEEEEDELEVADEEVMHRGRTSARRPSRSPSGQRNDAMFGGFSAASALQRFMRTRGKAMQAAVVATSDANSLTNKAVSLPQKLSAQAEKEIPDPAREKTHQDQPIAPLPQLPSVPADLPPCSFMVTAAFLQQRSLMKHLDKLYPQAEILYRDYSLPHCPFQEADFILSPSTGLILTTLQKVKQKALPGQPDRNPTKERMVALQSRYERLLVMISEGLNREMEGLGSSRPEDPRDKEALGHLETFASGLEGEVLPIFVRGGEQAFAHAIVLQMAKYGLPHGSADIGNIKPLPAETTWEVFLRRAGINPFAAQVIIASLKEPFDVQLPHLSSSPSEYIDPRIVAVSGLPAFLVMSAEERIQRFQVIMGGSRVLRQVSNVLDQGWVSAAHGFRM